MKKIIFFVAILFVAFSANAQMDAFTLRVEGLGCPFCAYGLEKKFKDVKGIKALKIDIQTGKMTFNVPAANKMTLTDADDRVTRAGYTAKGISVVRADGTTEQMGDVQTAVAPTAMNGKTETQTLKVSGNCEMCKARIEKAAKSVAGVSKADWNVDTKVLTIDYDPKKTKIADVQAAVARVGHDNEGAKADKKVYDNLPACCHYNRNH
jgi:periplasmic mercuric ion binding protein